MTLETGKQQQVEATLLRLKSLTAADGDSMTLTKDDQVERFFEDSIRLLDYCCCNDGHGDEVTLAELLACLRGAFGRAGGRENSATARRLLDGVVQKADDFLGKLVASFRVLCEKGGGGSNLTESSARILLRLAQLFTNILSLNYSTSSSDGDDHIDNSSIYFSEESK